MKKEVLFRLCLLFFTALAAGCGSKNNSPSSEEIQVNKLTATWKIKSVMKDGVAESAYDNLKLTISGSASSKSNVYAVSGRPAKNPWPAGGFWIFGSDVMTQLVRDKGTPDELRMTYLVDNTSLTIQFQFSGVGYAPGKMSSATGSWSIVFAR